ncbi:calcium-binding protein [uncultured Roseovarius sp.]|uniref:EF-hand domain-containing protein n=1 Tax=uncultured Roseovarius sp. TaxID=293344 RepID=UPI002610686C|nr:calcium-binding protein [uncultured Roseovarius sp.]
MKNTVLITSLGLAIIAGGAVASGDKAGGMKHRPQHSFEELDANGDGKLMQEEMAAHMQARFEGADANGDGVLSKDELLARINERMAKRAEKYAAHMLERRDANGDGALDMEEMKSRRDGKMFARMDADQDGAVTKEEFEAMRAKHKGHKRNGHAHGNKGQDPAE